MSRCNPQPLRCQRLANIQIPKPVYEIATMCVFVLYRMYIFYVSSSLVQV